MADNSRILCISDLHAPYMHRDTVPFLRAVQKKYAPTRVVLLGDEVDCFPETAEILTEIGWKTFREVIDGPKLRVAQWHDNRTISFVYPEAYVDKPNKQDLIRIEHSTYLSVTTPKHAIVKLHPETGVPHRREAWDSGGTRSWSIPRFGLCDGPGLSLTDDELRLQTAFQVDGTWTKKAAQFGFRRERKIKRMTELLDRLQITYNKRVNGREDTVFYIAQPPAYFSKSWDPEWLFQLNLDQRRVILMELVEWDGTPTSYGLRYGSVDRAARDWVQALAITCGAYSGRVGDHSYVDILPERQEETSQVSAKFTNESFTGNVCCVQVPTGMIMVRQEGHATVSGNCHAMSFHDSDPDLLSAGDELETAIASLRPIYKMFPEADILESNHGSMAFRKAKHHGIPRKYIRDYGDVLNAPKGWKWHDDLLLPTPDGQKTYFIHGISKDVMKVVGKRGINVVQGHFHTEFRIGYLGTPRALLWGMNVGCSIDSKSYAYAYDKVNLDRPIIGHGIIINGRPQLLPMILDGNGRWNGEVP